ncbi:helix-turn-helix transcriptional regulator [Streptomyces rubellomurinus]|uniref:Erythropoiesis-stimulating protein n=2 Tax=Streptomyces TaxID=1883 RepID=A0A0F2T670_STRR3|nr:helix-turn-helix transcriptional regulator [Streptomyces rubellomurinus]KJS57835.1 erythropoiesis-stimulating protein [Streptomyces rubellomurinus]
MLEMLGLDPAVEGVYRGMLTDPDAGVAELCARLALSESTVREALDELADLTIVRDSPFHPTGLRVVEPPVALELMLLRQEEELARRQHELAGQKAAMVQAVADCAQLRSGAAAVRGSERLVGMEAIQAKLRVLAKELQGECLAVMPGGGRSKESLDASRPLDAEALGRGVTLMTLYQDSVRNDPATLAYAQWMTDAGGQVRTAPVLPPRVLVFDRQVAVLPIDPKNTRRGALCTREQGIVAALLAMFEQAWDTAVPLGADRLREADTGLNPTEKELLKLLATGLTDEAASKRLGVSLRTVRRQMAALMERLDATSRFEAGLKAAQRGWL